MKTALAAAAALSLAAPVAAAEPATGRTEVAGRFTHGFRMGWTYIQNYDRPTREDGMSLKQELGLTAPSMTLLGYEASYRLAGRASLDVVMIGNVTVAGLEQTKVIPAASGLIGVELRRTFQVGVGVNVAPDPQAPSHLIAAAGWTPAIGSIQVPVQVFYIPDAEGNSRMGATVGTTW